MSNYYISGPNGTQAGPYDKATLFSLIKNHTYTPDCYIWCEGMADWKPFREVFPPKPKPSPAAPPAVPAAPTPVPGVPTAPNAPGVPAVPAGGNSVNKFFAVIKKNLKKIILGAVGTVLLFSFVFWWFFIRISISDDKELYTYLKERTDYLAYHVGGRVFDEDIIKDELTDRESEMRYTMVCICVCNCGEAAEYLLESRGNQIDKKDFLVAALQFGADDVAEVLVDDGVKLDHFNIESFIKNATKNAEKLSFAGTSETRGEFHESRDFEACAEMLFEDLGYKVPKHAKKAIRKLLDEMKMEEDGEDLAEYIEKHL